MLFNNREDGQIECIDWCDIEDDDVHIGIIAKHDDGYYRFKVTKLEPFTCGHLKRLADKLSELNKELRG